MTDYKKKLQSDDLEWDFNDWDNEESWLVIEQSLPNKKKRRFFFILFGIGAFILLSTLLFLTNRSDSNFIDKRNAQVIKKEDFIQSQSNLQTDEPTQENRNNNEKLKTSDALINTKTQKLKNKKEINTTQIALAKGSRKEKEYPTLENVNSRTSPNNNPEDLLSLQSYTAHHLIDRPSILQSNHKAQPISDLNIHLDQLKSEHETKLNKASHLASTKRPIFETPFAKKEATAEKVATNTISTNEQLANTPLIRMEQIYSLISIQNRNPKEMTLAWHVSMLEDEIEKTKNPIVISIAGAYQQFTKGLTTINSLKDEEIKLRNLTENPEDSFFFSLRLSKKIINDKLSLSAGLSYIHFKELLRHEFSSETTEMIASERASYFVVSPEDRYYLSGFLTQTTRTETIINKYNETRYLNLPIGILYKQPVSAKISLIAGADIHLALYHNQSGEYVNLNNELIEKQKPSLANGFLKPVGYAGHFGISYKLKTKISLSTSFHLMSLKSPKSNTEEYKEKFLSRGLRLGLNMTL